MASQKQQWQLDVRAQEGVYQDSISEGDTIYRWGWWEENRSAEPFIVLHG